MAAGTVAPSSFEAPRFKAGSRLGMRCQWRALPASQPDLPPDLVPITTVLVGHAAIFRMEFVRDLEHRNHQPAFGRGGGVATAGLAPHELAGADGEALGRAFLVDQLAGDH